MSVLVPNSQAIPDSAYGHLKLSSEPSIMIKMPPQRISDVNPRCLAPWSKHRLQNSIEIVAHDLYAMHESYFESRVARQQTPNDGGLLVEGHERRQN